MCGRVIQSSGPIRYAIVEGIDTTCATAASTTTRLGGMPPRVRSSLSFVVIIRPVRSRSIHCAGVSFPIGVRIRKAEPINAKCETVDRLPMFREAYRRRRCILPVDGFYEWKAIKGQKAKQPYAIAMKDGNPFGIGGLWENWKDPTSGEWIRSFAVITTDANELVAEIHDRMPLILAPSHYNRWLSEEPDPRDLLRPCRRSRCGYGRYRRASTSRKTMSLPFSSQWRLPVLRPNRA
jgi:putative SOS response-associated peptidase YedK